jgi:hypothetical protein
MEPNVGSTRGDFAPNRPTSTIGIVRSGQPRTPVTIQLESRTIAESTTAFPIDPPDRTRALAHSRVTSFANSRRTVPAKAPDMAMC